jgi:hypothetical protein
MAMKYIFALGVVAFLNMALALPLKAQQSLPSDGADGPCAQEEEAALSLPVTALVSKIDLKQGRATLETSVGKLELEAAPDELQALNTGDVLTLCVDPTALPNTDNAVPSSLS